MVARSVLFSLFFSIAGVAAPAIGIVTASGHFNVEGSEVWGNATLFDGATIETTSASSELALRNGVKVQLGAGSRARVWQNRLLLEKGVAQVAAPATFEARVTDQARLIRAPFRGVAFQAGPGQTTRAGCMVYKEGHFLVQDQTTQEVIEVSGTDLAANVGNRVEVRGAVLANRTGLAPATGLMNVVSIAVVSQGGCLSVAATLDAKAEAPSLANAVPPPPSTTPSTPPLSQTPAAHTGMSTGAKVGIIGAIAGGGAGAALALGGGKKSTSQ